MTDEKSLIVHGFLGLKILHVISHNTMNIPVMIRCSHPHCAVSNPFTCSSHLLYMMFFLKCIFIITCYHFSYSSDDPDILEWDEKSWRDADWVEQPKCKQTLGWDDSEDPAEFIYLENSDLRQYRWVGAWPFISVTWDCFWITMNSYGSPKWPLKQHKSV